MHPIPTKYIIPSSFPHTPTINQANSGKRESYWNYLSQAGIESRCYYRKFNNSPSHSSIQHSAAMQPLDTLTTCLSIAAIYFVILVSWISGYSSHLFTRLRFVYGRKLYKPFHLMRFLKKILVFCAKWKVGREKCWFCIWNVQMEWNICRLFICSVAVVNLAI